VCGIVGQARRREPVDPALLARMCAALEHRGPDARGTFAHDGAGLGIQRLRVIDLETGDQPVYTEDGNVVVVLNGEIYNYAELREELLAKGHRLSTQGDTEVIAHLYEEHGAELVHRLDGMFAFALWDRRRRRLLVARDRLGKKPLFYCERNGILSFASELPALLQDERIPRDPDPTALDCYLAYGYVPAPLSAFRHVRKLPPGHRLEWHDGRVRIERWWSLDYSAKLEETDPDAIAERVREALRAATRRRMVADVPLGAFLSGGIDSSAVVAAMAEASTQPVKTFSIGFDAEAFDELPYARAIAERFGTEHHELTVTPDAVAMLPKIVRHHGEPFADSSAIPSFYLARFTREHVTVALNGDGGDEAFGGYTRYVANALAARLDRVPLPVRRALQAGGRRLPAGGGVSSPANRARRLTSAMALDPGQRYERYVAWFDAGARAALYTRGFAADVDASVAAGVVAGPWAGASGDDVVDRMLEVDTATYLPGDLIPKIDIATMAYALEARSPLLDHHVMELAASIPASLKVRGREKKWILRHAMRGWLPDDILDRPKQGFSVPVSDWLRGDLRGWVDDVLLDPGTLDRGWFEPAQVRGLIERHRAGADSDAQRIWALLMLELWHRDVAVATRPAVLAA
jgi:asparagine synthase (glutamine-hydrolysing)